jgi:putative two-component system response regulator
MLLTGLPVLVIDDDPSSAKLIAVVLRGEGCDVRVAYSAEDALAMLDEFLPKVVVLDLILPMMSGVLLADRLRQNLITRDLAIIAVSVFDGPEAERIARLAGCDTFVQKPIDPMSFADVVLTHLRRASP